MNNLQPGTICEIVKSTITGSFPILTKQGNHSSNGCTCGSPLDENFVDNVNNCSYVMRWLDLGEEVVVIDQQDWKVRVRTIKDDQIGFVDVSQLKANVSNIYKILLAEDMVEFSRISGVPLTEDECAFITSIEKQPQQTSLKIPCVHVGKQCDCDCHSRRLLIHDHACCSKCLTCGFREPCTCDRCKG